MLPFVLQIVGAVALVGYFSYRSGQAAVADLAKQMMDQATARIRDRLDIILQEQQQIVKANAQSIQQDNFNIQDLNSLKKQLWLQINTCSLLSIISIANEQGQEIAYMRLISPEMLKQAEAVSGKNLKLGSVILSEVRGNPPRQRIYYSVNEKGQAEQVIYQVSLDPRQMDWYLVGKNFRKQMWSPIYFYRVIPSLGLNAVNPIYDAQQNLQGVLSTSVPLSDLGLFLSQLDFSPSGQAFILEPSGALVATSTGESPFIPSANGQLQRLPATQSQNPVTRAIALQLQERFGNLSSIQSHEGFKASLDGKNLFAQVEPYQDSYGLNWRVVTVIPEADFMGEIWGNLRRTLMLSGLTLLSTILIGFLTARWIARPIKQLSLTSEALAQGNWQDSLSEDSAIAELKSLAHSFNQMAIQVRQSFQQVEEELQGSRVLYQQVVQTQTDFILRSQPDTTITFANPALCDALGCTLEEIIGLKWINFVDPDDLEIVNQKIKHLSPENPSFVAENRDQRKNYQIGWTQWINLGLFNEQGQLSEIQSVGRDITPLKQTQLALQESQHFIERITQITPNLLYIYDLEEQRNIYANRTVGELLGYSTTEIQSLGADLFSTICHPEDLPRVYAAIADIQKLPSGEFLEIEYRIRDSQGHWRWIYSRDTVFARTDEGKVKQTLGTSQDITARKHAEIENLRTQNFLHSIIENLPDMVFVKDAETLKFVRLNKAGEDLLGYEREELLGKSDYDLFPPEQAEFFIAKDRDVLAKGTVLEIDEEWIQTRHQGQRLLHTKKIPILDESGNSKYLLGISVDITEQTELANRLTELARHIPGMIYQFRMRADGSFHFPYASEGIWDIYEVTPEEVKNDASQVLSVLHPDDLDRVYQSILDSAANLTLWHCEYRVCLANGQLIWALGEASPQREIDGSTIWHGYIKDISDAKRRETERQQAEMALQKAEMELRQANQELERLVNIDGLTQIANRRCFDRYLTQEWQRLCREQHPLSLLLIDVDFFKSYNDHYGHLMGDQCLIQLAQTIQRSVNRSMDLVARFGGEEFAVILPNTPLAGAIAVSERIHQVIRDLNLVHPVSAISQQVTLSLGVASLVPHSQYSPELLIDQADRALYLAKQQGRNQSVIFS
ncbi:MAG: diguanylate cyclase [Snowella sp.]|nr:diguanylate cyclase [Snowella sp.]